MEVLSSGKGGINGGESMAATNMVSVTPPFQSVGSVSESTAGITPGTPGPDIPAQADANTAGPGDRGGTVHGEGTAPGSGRTWGASGDASGDSSWTTATTPVTDPGH
jgi:hypothetical protein